MGLNMRQHASGCGFKALRDQVYPLALFAEGRILSGQELALVQTSAHETAHQS